MNAIYAHGNMAMAMLFTTTKNSTKTKLIVHLYIDVHLIGAKSDIRH